jgi:hypothetical protein
VRRDDARGRAAQTTQQRNLRAESVSSLLVEPAKSLLFFPRHTGSVSIPALGCGPHGCCVLIGAVELPAIARFPTTEENTTMKNAIVKTLTVGAAAIMLATATGCSNKELLTRVDAAEAAAKSAQQDAAAAKSAADAAASSASSASNAASAAQSTANQALQAAQGAQACCDATNEKIDRAFKKSMGK